MTEREVMAELVRFVGVLTYGKERWFKQNGCWYDRMFGDYIQNEVLLERITEAINDEIEDRPTGEWVKATGMMPPEFHGHHCCSVCGGFAGMEPPFGNREDFSKYCPNCGKYMKGENK